MKKTLIAILTAAGMPALLLRVSGHAGRAGHLRADPARAAADRVKMDGYGRARA